MEVSSRGVEAAMAEQDLDGPQVTDDLMLQEKEVSSFGAANRIRVGNPCRYAQPGPPSCMTAGQITRPAFPCVANITAVIGW